MSARKKTKVSRDLLMQSVLDFHHLFELIGIASGQLREAIGDHAHGNLRGAAIVADDAVLTLAELLDKTSNLSVKMARWQAMAEQSLEEGGLNHP